MSGPSYPGGAPHSRGRYTDTSHAAALAITERLTPLQAKALTAFRAAGAVGLTDDELAVATGEYRYTIAPRRRELVMHGWLEDTGARRPTSRHRFAIVWRARAERLSPEERETSRQRRSRMIERLAAAERRVAELELENAALRAKLASGTQGELFR